MNINFSETTDYKDMTIITDKPNDCYWLLMSESFDYQTGNLTKNYKQFVSLDNVKRYISTIKSA